MRRSLASIACLTVLLVLVATTALLTVGCTSSKRIEGDFPQSVEAVLETVPSEPDRIDYIDVDPWELKRGETAKVTVKATEGRTARVMLKGIDGEAEGKVVPLTLTPGPDGAYTGTITAGEDLPPGKYRVEAIVEGGPTGQPTKLVSSRAMTLIAPPAPDECMVAANEWMQPQIYFAFDRSDLDEAAQTRLLEVAAKLREFGPRVKGFAIHGHCDERGTIEYNLALGSRRAMAVRDFLASQPGLEGLAAETISHGEEDPIVPGARTEEDHAKNRRASFEMTCRAK